MKQHSFPTYAAAIAIAFAASPTFAAETGHGHGGHGSGRIEHAMDAAIGKKGDLANVRRSIRVTMKDNSYSPKSITVNKGETVRFIVENAGELVHEFNIGRAEMHTAHQAEMMTMMQSGALEADRIVHAKMGDMMHDDPNAVLLEPGKSGEVIWKFGTSGDLQFACNMPGHYEAGMHGMFNVR